MPTSSNIPQNRANAQPPGGAGGQVVPLLLTRLKEVAQVSEDSWKALCPAHDDHAPSLSVRLAEDGKVLVKCHAGCPTEKVVAALGLTMADLFPRDTHTPFLSPWKTGLRGCKGERKPKSDKGSRPASQGCIPGCGEDAGLQVPPSGLTREALAEAKKIPVEFLAKLGITNFNLQGTPCVKIPFKDEAGEEMAVRFRVALEGDDRFRWRRGSKALPYGLWRLSEARNVGWLFLVEGESDCWTLWYHNLPALGLPGASTWKTEWAEYLKGLEIYLWQEPDDAGASLAEKVVRDLPGVKIIRAAKDDKDPSAIYLQGKDLPAEIERLKAEAVPGETILAEKRDKELAELAAKAQKVLDHPDPLRLVEKEIRRRGYGGDTRFPVIAYLAATSRLLPIRPGQMPVHLGLQARASSGKSFALQRALDLLPPEAYHVIDAGSPRALIYDEADLRHRAVVFAEADSIPRDEDNPAASAIRSLLQNGEMNYEVVEKGEDGRFKTRRIHRPGPTVMITTGVHGFAEQFGTRLFTLTLPEDHERIKAILRTLAKNELEGIPDPDPALLDYQAYLQKLAPWDVVIPFAEALAEALSENPDVRVLRDFSRVLSLIKAVAILRHRHRRRDECGRLVAEIDDYRTVYELCREMYETTAAGCSPAVRELVALVAALREENDARPVSYSLLAERLKISRQAVQKRAKVALEEGWLVNRETKQGRPADLAPGDPLPEIYSLPAPEEIEAVDDLPWTCNPATGPQPGPQPGDASQEGRHDADSEDGRNPATRNSEESRRDIPPEDASLREKVISLAARRTPQEWRAARDQAEAGSVRWLLLNALANLAEEQRRGRDGRAWIHPAVELLKQDPGFLEDFGGDLPAGEDAA